MKNKGILYWILFFITFVAIWIGLDYVFSALRAAVWVFAKAFKTAIYSAVITTIVFYFVENIIKKIKK